MSSTKKSKKDKEKSTSKVQEKAKLSVFLEEDIGMRAINSMKAITAQELARNAGVKISVANAFIRSLESKGIVRCVGGYSGHKVYQLIKS
jgi:small subunit ribosomal protein S25e